MSHVHTIIVRGFHCDLYRHVNNARYLEFLEEARWEFVARSPELATLEGKSLGFVVSAITIEYKRPVGLGEVVEIRSAMAGIEAKRAVMHQEVYNQGTGKLVADARVSFAIIDLNTGRAVPLTDEMRSWFASDDAAGNPA
jgi:thioesterase-3